MFLSKYGEARVIEIPVIKRAVVDFAVGADWTPVAGDVKISKDGGAAANVTNLPTALVMGNGAAWIFSLTATEMQAARVLVTVVDAATKAVEDQSFIIETYGNAAAQHAFDLDTASVAQTGDAFTRLGAPAGASVSADVAGVQADTDNIQTRLPAALDTGRIIAKAEVVTDKSGYALSAAGVQAIWDALTSALTTAGSIGKLLVDNVNFSLTAIAAFIDTEVSAIKAKTDQLTFTIANKVDSSIQAAGDFAQAAADKVWASATRTLTAFSFAVDLSAAATQAVWDKLTSALTVVGSIGKLLVDNINATVGSRATQTSVDVIDDFVDTEVAAIKAATDQLAFTGGNVHARAVVVVDKTGYSLTDSPGIKKNTALNNFAFLLVDSTDHVTPKTGVAVTAQRSIDGAAFAACANAATEVASGVYKINLAATDLNGDVVVLKFTGAAADQRTLTVITET